MKDKIMCGCGYGKPTHPFEGSTEPRVHVVGEGTCRRMIAPPELVPKNFRLEVWTYYAGTIHENTFMTEVCDVNGVTITKYTLTEQRLYSYDNEFNVWTMPKNKESINSLGDDW